MGSGGNRKSNDSVRINLPEKRGSGSGGGSNSSRDINNVCPPAFEAIISPAKPLPNGTAVTVKGDELLVRGEIVGRLLPKHTKIIEECAGESIQYAGSVLNKDNGKVYAHFEQI